MMTWAGPARRAAVIALGMAVGVFLPAEGDCNQLESPAFRIQQAPGLPFGEAELRRLVALRLGEGAAAGCSTVSVTTAAEPGLCVVSCPDRRAEVWIGERTGEDAARIVAVVLVDLLTARTSAPVVDGPVVVAATLAPPAAPSPRRWSLWAAPGVAAGAWDGLAFEAHVGVGRAVSPRFGLLLDVGYAHRSGSAPKIDVSAALDEVPARLGASLAVGPLSVQAGAVVRVFRASAATARIGARPGAFVAGTWTFAPRWPVHPYVAAGVGVHPETLEIRVDELVALTAGRVTPWLAIGAKWSGASP